MKHKNQIINWGTDQFPDLMTAWEAAEKIARLCLGMYDWQGVREIEAPAGLQRLANLWLTVIKHRPDARIQETHYNGDTLSQYCSYWR